MQDVSAHETAHRAITAQEIKHIQIKAATERDLLTQQHQKQRQESAAELKAAEKRWQAQKIEIESVHQRREQRWRAQNGEHDAAQAVAAKHLEAETLHLRLAHTAVGPHVTGKPAAGEQQLERC